MAIDADFNGVIANVGNGVGHWKRMATRLARTLAEPQARSGTGRTERRAAATSGPKYRHDRTVTLRQRPALVRGVYQASARGQEQMTSYYRSELISLPEMELAARQVYRQAGLGLGDIDAACLYDAFTSEIIMQLESFGFCKPGEGKDLVRDGGLDIDGRLPNNTHGGLLSEAYIHGMNNIAEAVRLVRGESTAQPAKRVEHVLVSSGVGVPTGALILGPG